MSVEIAVEMDPGEGYASAHRSGCRDLRDAYAIGAAASRGAAMELIEEATGGNHRFISHPAHDSTKSHHYQRGRYPLALPPGRPRCHLGHARFAGVPDDK